MKEKKADSYRDILSQGEAWDSILEDESDIRLLVKKLKKENIKNIIFVGCGSSYYLAMSAAFLFKKITGVDSKAVSGSEIIFHSEVYMPQGISDDNKVLVVPISRSGKSAETIEAVNTIKDSNNVITMSVTCTKDSKLVEITDHFIYSKDGLEKSIIMTRSFTSMLLGIELFALLWAEEKEMIEDLKKISSIFKENISKWDEQIKDFAQDCDYKKYEFLAQGSRFGIANEAMLKMKEMAIMSSEDFHSLEFRHGPKSIADSDTLITMFIGENSYEREKKLCRELKSYKADLYLIGQKIDKELRELADITFNIESNIELTLLTPLFLVPVQLLAYHIAKKKGIDVESPRNLTKVVENI